MRVGVLYLHTVWPEQPQGPRPDQQGSGEHFLQDSETGTVALREYNGKTRQKTLLPERGGGGGK